MRVLLLILLTLLLLMMFGCTEENWVDCPINPNLRVGEKVRVVSPPFYKGCSGYVEFQHIQHVLRTKFCIGTQYTVILSECNGQELQLKIRTDGLKRSKP